MAARPRCMMLGRVVASAPTTTTFDADGTLPPVQ
jgi:hypothetical protein